MNKGILTILAGAVGAIAGVVIGSKVQGKTIRKKEQKINKFKSYYNLQNEWMIAKQKGKSLESYFITKGYYTIAIYGMGELGNRLYDELQGTSIEIKYAIDKNLDSTGAKLEVLKIEDELPEVDAMIATAIFEFDTIKEELSHKIKCPIISLEDVIYGI